LDRLEGRSILSALDVSRAELLDLFRIAAQLQLGRVRAGDALGGKIVLTAFFEPSTRTRLSFESAALRLGASVMSIPDARFTSVHKGESLADTGVMFNAYADVVVLRHTDERAVDKIRSIAMTIPLINGGNGRDEHPTQAIGDWYALLKWRNELGADNPPPSRRISLCILGVPRIMRSIRSFLLMAITHFPGALHDITVVAEEADPLGPELELAIRRAGVPHLCTRQFDDNAARFDVIYHNSLTLVGQEYHVSGASYRLTRNTPLKPDAVIMHPLARQAELGTDLDETPHNLYFDQAEGAVFVRQALLLAVLGRLQAAGRSESPGERVTA
jgi:aspartate carbamoyltransferase catalytic subunit